MLGLIQSLGLKLQLIQKNQGDSHAPVKRFFNQNLLPDVENWLSSFPTKLEKTSKSMTQKETNNEPCFGFLF